MSVSTPIQRSISPRVTGSVMLLCIVLSVCVHLGTAVGAGVYLAERAQPSRGASDGITIPKLPDPILPADPPLRLGRAESSTASISWLGVTRDPVQGEGKESTVEQAELAIVQGSESQATPTAPSPIQTPNQEPSPAAQPVQPIEQPVEQATEQALEPTPQLEAVPTDPEPEPEPETTPAPAEPVAEPTPEPQSPDPVLLEETPRDQEAQIPIAIETQTQAADPPTQTESPELTESAETAEPTPTTQAIQGPPVPQQTQQQTEQQAQPKPPSNATQAGKPGQEDDRESIATIIRKAQEVRATSLNQPLAGEGLEIKPVEPKFPASVRFTQLPRNPVVLIRFNAQGRVRSAKFLYDQDKKHTYDTGSKGVDEPLINAIYQWRASGKQLDSLDPADPESTIEISMKIIFREE